MKNILTITAIILGSQVFAQSAPLNGVELVKVEEDVFDFTINDEYEAHVLHNKLIQECIQYTRVNEDILDEDHLLATFFYFEDEVVLYVFHKGGKVGGSVLKKSF